MNAAATLTLALMMAFGGCPSSAPSGSAPSASDPSGRETIRQVTVRAPTGWLITIEANGSGSVGYGSSSHDFAAFPAATFDFAAVRDKLQHESAQDGSMQTHFAVAFARAGETSTTARYVLDASTIIDLFKKAVAAADKTGTRVAELYSSIPPAPDALPATGRD